MTAFVEIAGSPLLPDSGPARIYYRDTGAGPPLVFLHGGWGYEVYPFDRQIDALSGKRRILIPDRSGYGQSPRITSLLADFHPRAAIETARFLDALDIERAVLWGHSDGAVIAALMGLATPDRFSGLILEAFHYTRAKAGSIDFFRAMISEPDTVGERAAAALARDHGEDWRRVLERNATAWLEIVASGPGDLYKCKLSELSVPALFLNGSRDPRTEPGDLEAIRRELPRAEVRIIEGAGHSPHSEPRAADECSSAAAAFLERIGA
jgi:pimeloyl-ACP methyl ester carboxylesterase